MSRILVSLGTPTIHQKILKKKKDTCAPRWPLGHPWVEGAKMIHKSEGNGVPNPYLDIRISVPTRMEANHEHVKNTNNCQLFDQFLLTMYDRHRQDSSWWSNITYFVAKNIIGNLILFSAQLETPRKKYILFFNFDRGAIAPGPPTLITWGLYNLERYYMDHTAHIYLECSTNMDCTLHVWALFHEKLTVRSMFDLYSRHTRTVRTI